MKNALIAISGLLLFALVKPANSFGQQFPQDQYIIKEANPPAKIIAAYQAWRQTELGIIIENSPMSGSEELPEFIGFYQIIEIGFPQNTDQYYAVYRHSNNYLSAVKIGGNGQTTYKSWMNFMHFNVFQSYLNR